MQTHSEYKITRQNEPLNLNQVVALLGVSAATVRNWIKHHYLTPQASKNRQWVFKFEEVHALKQKIAAGEVHRLNKRANKKSSQTTFIPDEYMAHSEFVDWIQEMIGACKAKGLTREKVLYSIALNLLRNKRLVNDNFIPRNEVVQQELQWWEGQTKQQSKPDKDLLQARLPEANDMLGVVYQSFLTEGNKNENGSYYTPRQVVDEIVEAYVKKNHLVLDPCCGTGQFLLAIAEKVKDPRQVWGFDRDEIAVRLARLNLLLHFPDVDFEPQVYHKNALILANTLLDQEEIPVFDLVLTNPPWGVHAAKEEILELQAIYPEIHSGEAFSYFIKQGLHLLKDEGVLSFILPESILNIKTHRDIREILVKKTTIQKVKYLNRIFKNVFTNVIRLDVLKKEPPRNHVLRSEKDGFEYELEQFRLQNHSDFRLNVFTSQADLSLLDKVYCLPHTTLKNQADWALGVVTGDNKKYLTTRQTHTNEPILTGKDIKKFINVPATHYIDFMPSQFQQVAPEAKYRAKEKLFYKFISKELVFSYDDQQTLSLNSANILIPQIANYPITTLLALLNSSLYQFLYQKKFATLKILKNDLEQLPLPLIDNKRHAEIGKWVKQLLDHTQATTSRKKAFAALDDLIMSALFQLNQDEKTHIKQSIKVSDHLLNNRFPSIRSEIK